tara:strand:+ start:788 stop:1378 length:591 start_codon:yes stop_codon:yes gene_type:complete
MVKPREKPHYVNNAEFSQAVVDYVKTVMVAKEQEVKLPIVTDYLAGCFLRISEGLSHKSNFIRYTYREEMVMDAVENCLKAIENYNIEAATRTGKPNAFAYFTQISWYAFLRRIAKEKKQQDIKFKYLSQSGIEAFMDVGAHGNMAAANQEQHFVDILKGRIQKVKGVDNQVKEFVKKEKVKRKKIVDSDLQDFMN